MHLKTPALFRESFLSVTWLAVLVSLCAAPMSFGHEEFPEFTRLESPEQPHRSIFALLQDSDGFLWIGTQDGLARYDGYEMRTLRHDPGNPQSLSNSSVRTILEDRRGRLWIGTENGLNILDRRQFTITRIPTPGHPEGRGAWFHCAFADRDGVLWFGTDDGLLRHEPHTEIFQLTRSDNGGQESLAHTAVVGIQQDADGAIWVATSDFTSQALHRLSRRGAVHSRFLLGGPPSRRRAFLIDSRGRFWTHPSAPIDLSPGHSAADLRPAANLCSETRAIIERADGGIWFACDDGLHRIDPASGDLVSHPIVPSDGTWLENFGRSLVDDRSGTLWVGTEGGLFRHDPNSKEFRQLHRNPLNPRSLSADAVSAVAEAPDNHLWVATYGGGLNHVDRATGEARTFCTDPHRPDRCTSDVIWHLHTSVDGTLWIAGDELWSLDPSDETLTLHSAAVAIDEYLTYIVEDAGGVLWIGGTGGRLYRYTIATGVFETVAFDLEHRNTENGNRPDSMLLEGDTLWIGFGHALGVYDTTTGRLATIPLTSPDGSDLSSLGTWVIHRGTDGSLWLGSSLGLTRHRPDGRFQLLTTHDGLPGSAVYSIMEESNGALWLGTNQGLVRFHPDLPPGARFRSFSKIRGSGNVEFNRHATFECADGTMVFGGMDGLTLFQPDAVRDNPFVPPVRITAIEISSREGVRTIEPTGLDRLTLAPGDTTAAFTFAALSFTSPELNRYAYQLEGFDEAWTEAGTRRTTQYTNLPPGHYRLRVKGSNNDGVWNEERTSLEVIVLPTLWETLWFRPMLIAILGAAIWAGCRYRVSKQRELERLRMRIAGDLHDDLSSDLSGIAVLADMVRQSEGLGAEERDDLGQIRDASMRMVDGLRDIVWYIDPDHDSLKATVRRMRSVASTLLRGVRHDLHAEIPDRDLPLPVNTRRNVFLVFKEAVHNIVRHADASRVEMEITVVGSRLQLSIADDGRGFDPTRADDGHGLRSMRRRAEEMGGRLEIDSTPGGGARLRLVVEMAGSRDGRGTPSGLMVDGVYNKDRKD